MTFTAYITHIREHLVITHAELLSSFSISTEEREYRPQDGGWTISEILEHISLTSYFLLKLIRKGADKSLKKFETLGTPLELTNSSDLDRIEAIGLHKSFDWIRPDHMEPSGNKDDRTIKTELKGQLAECLQVLNKLDAGQGTLQLTTMSVNGLGKIDVYEYIYFLSKHAERHLQQIEENRVEYVDAESN